MPVLIDPADFVAWFEPKEAPIARAPLRAYPAHRLDATPVSTRVNNPKNDDPAIIEPI